MKWSERYMEKIVTHIDQVKIGDLLSYECDDNPGKKRYWVLNSIDVRGNMRGFFSNNKQKAINMSVPSQDNLCNSGCMDFDDRDITIRKELR